MYYYVSFLKNDSGQKFVQTLLKTIFFLIFYQDFLIFEWSCQLMKINRESQ
jgi:hypothetical protein